MTGVGVTASGLRSAAESHAELLGDANIRSALSYAEGHSSKSNTGHVMGHTDRSQL